MTRLLPLLCAVALCTAYNPPIIRDTGGHPVSVTAEEMLKLMDSADEHLYGGELYDGSHEGFGTGSGSGGVTAEDEWDGYEEDSAAAAAEMKLAVQAMIEVEHAQLKASNEEATTTSTSANGAVPVYAPIAVGLCVAYGE